MELKFYLIGCACEEGGRAVSGLLLSNLELSVRIVLPPLARSGLVPQID